MEPAWISLWQNQGLRKHGKVGSCQGFTQLSNICDNAEMQGKVGLDFAVIIAFCKALSHVT